MKVRVRNPAKGRLKLDTVALVRTKVEYLRGDLTSEYLTNKEVPTSQHSTPQYAILKL